MQIAQKHRGRLEILQHLGSAHTDAELGLLVEQARTALEGDQQTLDLHTPARVQHMSDTADWTERSMSTQRDPSEGRTAPAGRTTGTHSRLLHEAIGAVYDALGFDVLDDAVFRDLVIARLVEPTSKLDAGRVLADLGAHPPSYSTIQRHLRKAQRQDYRSTVADACFGHAGTSGDLSLVLYDVTTLYFEAENEDELRKVGYSKERRVDPQIVVGLLVDRNGFPLEIGCFEGNHAETRTIVPIVGQFQQRHSLADMAVVADAGMLSATNLAELERSHLRFIVGSRQTKAPGDLAHHFGWHGDAFTDGQTVDTLTPRRGKGTGQGPRPQRAEPVWDPGRHQNSWRAIWQYRTKRAVRDQKTLTGQENRARAVIAGEKQVKGARFVKTTGAGRSLDEASLARARSLVGLKGYVTNIPAPVMPAAEVISSYHDLWVRREALGIEGGVRPLRWGVAESQ